MWANQSFENEETRKQNLALSALSFNQSVKLGDIEQDNQLSGLIGGFGVDFLGQAINSFTSSSGSSSSSGSGSISQPPAFFTQGGT